MYTINFEDFCRAGSKGSISCYLNILFYAVLFGVTRERKAKKQVR